MAENLNQTPNASRLHIAFFGRRNVGKSSLVNAVTGQEISIVSDVKGTTTDPVSKAMELLPFGPVLITDTPGLDDAGPVGDQRVRRANRVLEKTDMAILVTDAAGLGEEEQALVKLFEARSLPYLIVFNKADLKAPGSLPENALAVSALKGEGIRELKDRMAQLAKKEEKEKPLLGDKLKEGDLVVLVTPIDSSAPKGRMILPQVQAIRDILDNRATCVVTQPAELPGVLANLKNPPAMVITDSQAFGQIKSMVPPEIPLTSFSIVFARFKGFLSGAVAGVAALERLKDGDRILICEGCTHHRQCEDIGTVKLPRLIAAHTGKTFRYEFTSGGGYPEDLSPYALILHCGACMLNDREMLYRKNLAASHGIPFTNYGITLAYLNGILPRSLELFPEVRNLLNP